MQVKLSHDLTCMHYALIVLHYTGRVMGALYSTLLRLECVSVHAAIIIIIIRKVNIGNNNINQH